MGPVIGITPELIRIPKQAQSEAEGKQTLSLDDRYCRALRDAGGIPVLLPPALDPREIQTLLRKIDGLLLSGGDDIDPRFYGESPVSSLNLSADLRTEHEILLIQEAIHSHRPVLGICLGMQTMNVALGGSLIQDIAVQRPGSLNHRGVHPVDLQGGTLLTRILPAQKSISVRSSHHQAIDRIGDRLRVSAYAPDGIIEAIEIPGHPFFVGVQWHPERGRDGTHDRALFEAFVKACHSSAFGSQ
jgi:putative glutamine amidotransferase